jgi:hypothetical protein
LIAWGHSGINMAATTVTAPNRSVALHLDQPGTFLGVAQPGSYGGFTTWAIGEWGIGVGVDSAGAYRLDLIPPGSWTIRFTRNDSTGAACMVGEILATMPGPGQTVTLPPVQLTPVAAPATAAPYTP